MNRASRAVAGCGLWLLSVLPMAAAEGGHAPGTYVGPASCASYNCHGRSEPANETPVLQNEYSTWVHRDPHFRSHEALFVERSRIIVRNLGEQRPAHANVLCLSCHALLVPEERRGERLDLEDGISCEACHGPAGGWLEGHTEPGWTHEDSVRAGMLDLRRPEQRSEVCFGCHLGGDGREVDHKLIAAGHPELLFELDNFAEAMPRHWRSFEYRVPGTGSTEPPATVWALGQVASFAAALEQLERRVAGGRWPELADLDCESCHHPLGEERWRHRAPAGTSPGSPPWNPVRWALLRHLLADRAPQRHAVLVDQVDELARLVGDLRTPPDHVARQASRVAGDLDGLGATLSAVRWDADGLRRLMVAIAADREFLRAADRPSAEQAALAIQSLYSSLMAVAPEWGRSPARATLGELFDELEKPYEYRAEPFLEILERLQSELE